MDVIGKLGVKKPATRKNRNRDHIDATGARDQIGRHGHFRHLEFLKLELAPKRFGGMGIGRDQLDAFRLDRSVHKRLDPLIERGDKAQSQFRHRFSFTWTSSRRLYRSQLVSVSCGIKDVFTADFLKKGRYESSVSAANSSSTFILRGVSPVSYEYTVIVSSIGALALIP